MSTTNDGTFAATQQAYEELCNGYDKSTNAVQISVAEALKLYQAGKVLFLDNRAEEEYRVSAIPGAILLPPTKVGIGLESTVGRGMSYERDVPPAPSADTTVVCYCTAGLRSGYCSNSLSRQYKRPVLNLHGGLIAWFNAGAPMAVPAAPSAAAAAVATSTTKTKNEAPANNDTEEEKVKIMVHAYGASFAKYIREGHAFF